jgi:anti-sigma factor RsiW
MTTRITGHEWEDLSAYLDGQLSLKDSAHLEEKLQASADLRAALDELRHTRSLLRIQPVIRAPRNFLLTPSMVSEPRPRARSFRMFPAMRLASALAFALFILVLAGDFLTGGGPPAVGPVAFQSMQMAAPAAEMKSAPVEAPAPQGETVIEAPAVPEAATEANLAEGVTAAPAPTLGAAMLQDAGTGTEAYPPPGEAAGVAPPARQQAAPTPYLLQPAPLTLEQEYPAQGNTVQVTGTSVSAIAPAWPGWRIFEVALALLFLITAGWAFYLRKSRGV